MEFYPKAPFGTTSQFRPKPPPDAPARTGPCPFGNSALRHGFQKAEIASFVGLQDMLGVKPVMAAT